MGTAKSVEIELRTIREKQDDIRIAVIDRVRGNIYFDVTESMLYTFIAGKEASREMTIVAGTEAYVADKVAGLKAAPKEFSLCQNYPNPFNPVTSIKFAVPQLKGTAEMPGAEWACLKVYNIRGQEITTLMNSPVQSGYYTSNWNGRDYANRPCATGTYIYRLMVGNKFNKSIRMTLVK
jgi:hypothetical protein